MLETIKGLVISETNFGENNKYITILTEVGKIDVLCTGAQKKGKFLTVTRLFCYAEFTLYKNRDKYRLNEAEIIINFTKIAEDLEKYALSCYFISLIRILTDQHFTHDEFLNLLLHTLYILSEKQRDLKIVKAAFEMRISALSGFMPAIDTCNMCNSKHFENVVFFVHDGIVICDNCQPLYEGINLSKGVYDALYYILTCEIKKIYSFSLGQENLIALSKICELFILSKIETKPNTLEFYKKLTD